MKKICVIGGGAAGLMAAYAAAKNGHHVTLLEKNDKLGKKIYITMNIISRDNDLDRIAEYERGDVILPTTFLLMNSCKTWFAGRNSYVV